MINIPQIDPDGVSGFSLDALKDKELILIESRPCKLIRPSEAHDEDVDDDPVELENEAGELEHHEHPIEIDMVHILEIDRYIVLGSHVVCQIAVHNEPEQPIQQSQIYFLINFIQPGLQQHY